MIQERYESDRTKADKKSYTTLSALRIPYVYSVHARSRPVVFNGATRTRKAEEAHNVLVQQYT